MHTSGAMTKAILRLRSCKPMACNSQPSGLMMLNTILLGQAAGTWRGLLPFSPQENEDDISCEGRAEDCRRHGDRENERVSLEESTAEAIGIALQTRQRREGDTTEGEVESLRRHVDELIGSAVEAQGVGAKISPEQNLLEIVGGVDDESVECDRAAEAQHGRDAGAAADVPGN